MKKTASLTPYVFYSSTIEKKRHQVFRRIAV